MRKIIAKEAYHDGLTRVVFDDLTIEVVSERIPNDVPNINEVLECIDKQGLFCEGNIRVISN